MSDCRLSTTINMATGASYNDIQDTIFSNIPFEVDNTCVFRIQTYYDYFSATPNKEYTGSPDETLLQNCLNVNNITLDATACLKSTKGSFPITCHWTLPSDSNTRIPYFICTCPTSTCDISNIIDTTPDSNPNKDIPLTQISLSGTGITTIIISDPTKLANLESLNLQGLGIKNIANLSPLQSLQNLYLAYNSLEYVPTVQDLPSLLVLNLTSNEIKSIQSNAFDGTPNISGLFLAHNKITELEDGTFSNFAASIGNSNLHLSHNSIAAFNLKAFPDNITAISLLSLCSNTGDSVKACTDLGFKQPHPGTGPICAAGPCLY